MTLTTSRTSLSHLVTALARVTHRVDHRAELIAELQTAPLVPAVFLPGIEHQDTGEIVRTGLQSVVHQRRTLHRHINEHLFLDVAAQTGVRVMACRDDRAHRVRMHVAEVGEPGLWDRVVVHFTQLEMHGQTARPSERCRDGRDYSPSMTTRLWLPARRAPGPPGNTGPRNSQTPLKR